MLEIVKFEMKHFEEIDLQEMDKREVENIPYFKVLAEAYQKTGGAYTLLSPEGIVCIAGIFPMWPGVGSAWSLTSPLVKKYPLSYFRGTKDFLNAIASDWKLHRIQATIHSENEAAIRWVRHLGFKQEGVMRAYDPDKKDHILCAKVN